MKNLIPALLLLLLITGCQKECDQWHTGKKCETEIRYTYIGTYNAFNTVLGIDDEIEIAIPTNYSSDKELKLSVFNIELTTPNSFEMDKQYEVASGAIHSFEGYGYFTDNTITVYMLVDDTGPMLITTYTKQ